MSEEYVKRKMSDKESAFWARYAATLYDKGISGHNGEWHARRAQQFVYGLNGRKLREIDSAYLDECPDAIGRSSALQDCHPFQSLPRVRGTSLRVAVAAGDEGGFWGQSA